jgi:sigma-54 dependent transcriptional regulator, acetoin dehydrogenase operon transcriptional activator AcoR
VKPCHDDGWGRKVEFVRFPVGYSKGAFTGAREQGHAGKIEAADGGVLCLDEIGEMPLELQPYLLRVLEDGVVYRIGSNEGRSVRVRLICMTNRNLLAEAGRFRRDLYYRIAVLRLTIPPLRSRGDDVVLLAHHFAGLAAARLEQPLPQFDDQVLRIFRLYSWPGNVRELRSVVENMILLGNPDRLEIDDVPMEVREQVSRPIVALSPEQQSSSVSPNLKLSERVAIEAAVAEARGNLLTPRNGLVSPVQHFTGSSTSTVLLDPRNELPARNVRISVNRTIECSRIGHLIR